MSVERPARIEAEERRASVALALILVALVIAAGAGGYAAGLLHASALPAPAPRKPAATVVLPTCAELDEVGYDGLASCVDSKGQIVRPGG